MLQEKDLADLRQQVRVLEARLDELARQRDAERAAAEAALARASIVKVVRGPVRALMKDVGSILAPVVRVPCMACSSFPSQLGSVRGTPGAQPASRT